MRPDRPNATYRTSTCPQCRFRSGTRLSDQCEWRGCHGPMTGPILRAAGIRNVQFGANVAVVEPVNLYDCTIGDGSFVGPFVEIQRGVTIGKRCKIQSHAFICELVSIGDDCFISHGAMFINDPFTTGGPAGKLELWRSTTIGNGVSIGTNATIMPVNICDRAVVGAGAVVTRDITEAGFYVGNPARLLRRLESLPAETSMFLQLGACAFQSTLLSFLKKRRFTSPTYTLST